MSKKSLKQKAMEAFGGSTTKTPKQTIVEKQGKVSGYIKKITEETGITPHEIEEMVKEKREELKGLISEEGALFVIAKELGVIPMKTETEAFTEVAPVEIIKNPQPKVKQLIPSFICLFNGRHGSGKTTAAELFDTPFIMDTERGKDTDAIPYSSYETIKKLRIGSMEDIKKGNINIDIVDVQGKNLEDMWSNIQTVFKWYIEKGYKNHRTFVIGKGSLLRSSRIAVEEKKKGRRITKFEYRPISEDNQELIYDLIRECREKHLNLIIISHWDFRYLTIKRDSGYTDSEAVGEIPDVKEWIVRAVTWRVDFLKPEESGFNGKYIAYFDKAPRNQYKYLDITNKNLFNIINDLDKFNEEVVAFEKSKEDFATNEKKDAFGGK